ncbi:MAG: hypothetical protein JJV97_04690 [SAR324 cluster bacterium]|nr:hypothetical protein [SAR324 cluster bacterium]
MKVIIVILLLLGLYTSGATKVEAQNSGEPIFRRITIYTASGGVIGAAIGAAVWLTDPLENKNLRDDMLMGFGIGCMIGLGVGAYQISQKTVSAPSRFGELKEEKKDGLFYGELIEGQRNKTNSLSRINIDEFIKEKSASKILAMKRPDSEESKKRYNLLNLQYYY